MRNRIISLISLLLITGSFSFDHANAAILVDQKGVGWASYRDLTDQRFAAKFQEYSELGYMMIDVDAYPYGDSVGYSMVWRENTDARGWAERRGMTSDRYQQRLYVPE